MAKTNRFKNTHPPIENNDPLTLITSGITQEPEVVEEVVEEVKPKTKTNPLAGMIESKPDSKSYGFYLSDEAVAKLEKLAKQNKCSKSKALDMLLRSIL